MKAILFVTGLVLMVTLSSFKGEKNAASAESAPVSNSSIAGVVLDRLTGEALTGVEVRVEGTELKAYTDFDGKFVFEGLKAGNYKVCTGYISYKCVETPVLSIKTNELHALNIELEMINK